MQGVIKSFDPGTGDGIVIEQTEFHEYDLAENALEGSIFRMPVSYTHLTLPTKA